MFRLFGLLQTNNISIIWLSNLLPMRVLGEDKIERFEDTNGVIRSCQSKER